MKRIRQGTLVLRMPLLLAGLALTALVTGCVVSTRGSRAAAAHAPDSIRGFSVYVDHTVARQGPAGDPVTFERARDELLANIEQDLVADGAKTTTDRDTADLVVSLTVRESNTNFIGVVWMRLSHGEQRVGDIEINYEEERSLHTIADLAAALVSRLVSDTRVVAAVKASMVASSNRGGDVAAQPAPSAQSSVAASTRPTAASAPPSEPLVSATPQPANYALIVGIEHYRDVPAATGAVADAQAMTRVMKRTLGLREEHVHTLLDDHATRADILGELDWLAQNVSAGGRVYFYFSGHGAPNAGDQSAYLLPYDANQRNIGQSGIPVADLNQRLGRTKAREVLAMLDSCFSGAGGRSVLPAGARPLLRVKEEAPASQMATITASGGDEISGSAPDESGGVFTKYVVRALSGGKADINGDGQISLQELFDWIGPRVAQDAKRDNRDQHPHLVMGNGAGDAKAFVVEYGLPTN